MFLLFWDDVGSEATRAAMNDSPVDCQNREWTEPQRDHRPLRIYPASVGIVGADIIRPFAALAGGGGTPPIHRHCSRFCRGGPLCSPVSSIAVAP